MTDAGQGKIRNPHDIVAPPSPKMMMMIMKLSLVVIVIEEGQKFPMKMLVDLSITMAKEQMMVKQKTVKTIITR